MNTIRVVFAFIGGVLVLLLLAFVFNSYDLFGYQFFGPKYENTRNQIYQNSQAYNDGQIRHLQDLKMQYEAADDNAKVGIRAIILQQFSNYRNIDTMPSDLRTFYYALQHGG